jgi:HlyD family secretion protein
MHMDSAQGQSARAAEGTAGDPEVVKTLGVTKSKSRGRRIARWLLLVVLLAAAGGGVFRYLRAREAKAVPEYRSADVTRADIRVTITATGTVKGLNTVEVGAEISGKVTKVHVDFNDRVKKGQVLAEIDPEQLRAAMDEASARVGDADASIRQARATLTEAKQNAARAEQQASQGLISQKELEAAKAAAERAEASLSGAVAGATVSRASLKSSKSKLEKTTIVSPIDGIVLSRLVEPGQTVSAGMSTPVMFKVAEDLTRMSLNVFIDEADVGRAKEEQEASFTVDAYPGKTFASKVLQLRNEPKTEQNVVTYEAVLAVDNQELLLRPGMTATATIVAEVHKDIIAVPNAALRFVPPGMGPPSGGGVRIPGVRVPGATGGGQGRNNKRPGDGPRVWILKDGAPAAVPVKVGSSDGRVTEIVSGDVTPGMKVLVDVVEKGS